MFRKVLIVTSNNSIDRSDFNRSYFYIFTNRMIVSGRYLSMYLSTLFAFSFSCWDTLSNKYKNLTFWIVLHTWKFLFLRQIKSPFSYVVWNCLGGFMVGLSQMYVWNFWYSVNWIDSLYSFSFEFLRFAILDFLFSEKWLLRNRNLVYIDFFTNQNRITVCILTTTLRILHRSAMYNLPYTEWKAKDDYSSYSHFELHWFICR
jgi:hypothetical protein